MNGIFVLLAVAVAFAVTALLGKKVIPFLHKLKYGQTILDIGPAWHKKKQGTPTMGGVMLIIGCFLAIILCVPLYTVFAVNHELITLESVRVYAGLVMALAYGLIGFFDDYIKVVKKRNQGLTARQKLLLQILVGSLYLFSLYLAGADGSTLVPFIGTVNLGLFYWPVALFIIVGTVNSVNLTDGIDGLASSVTFFAAVVLMVAASMLGKIGLSIAGAALGGACLGFLVWNFYPAKVFMGDTGSLFLGGMVCMLAFGLNMPILLIFVGVVYLMETLSDIIQILYFKATKGKRIFKMAPIHHHFEMSGWSEVKIVVVFSIITMVGGILALLGIYLGIKV